MQMGPGNMNPFQMQQWQQFRAMNQMNFVNQMKNQQQPQQQMETGVRPFVVNSVMNTENTGNSGNSSPELDLLASCQPLPESVMNGTLDDIVDQVISDNSNSLSSFSQ